MASKTLIIKRLPSQLSNEDKVAFLKQYGAVDVKIISSRLKKYNLAFARFPTEYHAEQALHYLHQQEVMGSYIVAEYARGKEENLVVVEDGNCESKMQLLKETGTEILLKKFLDKLNNWTAGVEFRAPVPSHLRYHYPPPTTATLRNITQQLAASPRLYTQVLHLMNKMNLPCPIAPDIPAPPSFYHPTAIWAEIPSVPVPPVPKSPSESESELSSEEDRLKETIPDIKPKPKKVLKRPKVVKPVKLQPVAKTRKTTFDEVFEDPKSVTDSSKPKKPKLLEPPSAKVPKEGPDARGFGFIHPVVQPKDQEKAKEPVDVRNEMEEERLVKEKIECITLEALSANRIPEKDRAVLPVFKNYAEGAPTCRLYVKNLAKQTTEEDLRFIFSRFISEDSEVPTNMFDIRLMQEGRMKGQAFVTLQTVELAQAALAATNGYILNDKPMVVQFARSAVK